jgi:integrase
MALIVKCRGCHRRVPETETICPFCGGIDFRFIIDYWPRGRRGGRKNITLPAGIRNREDAVNMERTFHRARVSRKSIEPTSQAVIVSDLFPDYLKWYKIHRAETSYIDITYALRKLEPILGWYQVREIAPEHFSLYQQMRTATGKNRATNKELDYFKGFLKWCRREKKIEIQKIEYEPLPYKRPLPVVLTPEEIDAIMKAAKKEPLWHAFLTCLYYLGFRLGAVSKLKPAYFDFQGRTVEIRQKGGSFIIQPLNKQVIAAVKKLIKIRSCGPDDYLFVTRFSKGKPVKNVRQAISRICKRAGVIKRVYPHLFRHSVATEMMSRGVGIRIIQDFLGHKNLKNTEFYTHVSLENLRAAQALVSTHNPRIVG